mgnify:CR=1 FL=1
MFKQELVVRRNGGRGLGEVGLPVRGLLVGVEHAIRKMLGCVWSHEQTGFATELLAENDPIQGSLEPREMTPPSPAFSCLQSVGQRAPKIR